MNVQKILASVFAYLQHLENAMDHDPIGAQAHRLVVLERKMDEISGRLQEFALAREPTQGTDPAP